jgi:hypothetical protein
MAFDPYSICPGGTGKKVKFCCSDLIPDLEKIDRMLEGEQYVACQQHIERLEPKFGDRACLLALKAELLRAIGRAEEAEATVARFREQQPHNPVALAEAAMVASERQGGRAAMDLLQQALGASTGPLEPRVYQAIRVVAAALLSEGEFIATRALAALQATIYPEDQRAMELMVHLNTHPRAPLLVKTERRLAEAPQDAPWKAAADEALVAVHKAHWAEAAARFAALAEQYPDVPPIWRNLGILRSWLADTAGAIAAWEKYATLDVPLEDAVEAETLARLLADDPLVDQLELVDLTYPVTDAEQLQLALVSSPYLAPSQVDPASLATEDEPPPRAIFMLFDRPRPTAGQPLDPDTVPRLIGQMLLFGRQTDRLARLEVMDVVRRDLDQVKSRLAEIGGTQLGALSKEESTEKLSASQETLSRTWWLPEGVRREDLMRLTEQHQEKAVLSRWPEMPLGLLDGKTPREAAGQQAYRVKVLAAILVLEHWLEAIGGRIDLNRLRSQLGLPTLEPIDPQQVDVKQLPLVRLSRLVVDKLSDEALLSAYHRVMAFNARMMMEQFARAIVQRPSMAGKEEQLHALMILARTVEDTDKALQYVDQGRQKSEAAGQSSASWDLLELSFRFQRAEGHEALRLIQHLQRQHIREPGVAEALTDLLVNVGVLRPDGTMAIPSAPPPEPSGIVLPDASGTKPGELWTPDSQTPQGEKPKLWMPGME